MAPGGPPDGSEEEGRDQQAQQAPPRRQGPQRSERRIADQGDKRRRPFVAVETDWGGDDLLAARWGPTGYAVWVKFLQACKRSTVEGRVSFRSEEQLRSELRIVGWELLDVEGKPFGLEEFFTWTGRRKWTRRNRARDGRPYVECRNWDDLQRRRRPILGESRGDPGNIPGSSREIRRSERRNVHPDKTRQDSTTTGGAVLSPESSDAPSARSPQGARSGRSSQKHPDHEHGDWSACIGAGVLCEHGACPVECGRCQDARRQTA